MEKQRKIRRGEIYWLDDCPPLDGHQEKRRPVVVLGHTNPLDRTSRVLVVGISHTASNLDNDPDMIRLPDIQQSPTVVTGLNRPSWAIPRWFLLVLPERLGDLTGHIKGDLLKRLVIAVDKRVSDSSKPT